MQSKESQRKSQQQTEQWEDEKKNEETKRKTIRLESAKKSAKFAREESKQKSVGYGEHDDEISGFNFENYLGAALRITLENHDNWQELGFELDDDQEDVSVINFLEWGS